MVLEKTLESPLDCKEIQPVHSKGDQPWVFIGRADAKAETPILWPPHAKSWLIGKDAGRDWGQEEKGTTEDEMAGWHHRLDGREFGWTPGVGDGQEAWCAEICGVAKSQTWLRNWTELNWSWCMSFLMCCWILFAKILLRIFSSMFISDIDLEFSFCVLSLFGLIDGGLVEWVW